MLLLIVPVLAFAGIGIEALFNSPYTGIAAELFDAHYSWIRASEKGSIADPTIPESQMMGWLASDTPATQYIKPKRYYSRFMSPMELTFAGIGEQFGQGLGAGMQIAANIKELDIKLKRARESFYECLPDCSELFQQSVVLGK